jgi:hypothetical protein
MVVRDLSKLSPAMLRKVAKLRKTLTGNRVAQQATFGSFELNGKEHIAYFVPRRGPRNRFTYVFECLLY